MFVDTHCHYSDEAFRDDADLAIGRALEAGVGMMIHADTCREERPAMIEVCRRHPGVLFEMRGVYPCNALEDWRDEVDAMEKSITPEVVAIGEIGLDYHEGREFAAEQRDALMAQFEIAATRDLPVNIHLRDATEDFIRAVKDAAHLHLRGDLHCFSLSLEAYRELIRYADFSVGIGGVVTFKKAKVAETIKEIPLEKILLETDCPYLAPMPWRGTRNESKYIPLIAAKVAEIKGLSVEEVEMATTRGARELFNI